MNNPRAEYFRTYMRNAYASNPEKHKAIQRDRTKRGFTSRNQKKRAERLADSYIKRCLVQRGWSKEDIETIRTIVPAWELIRMHIKAKREIRKCRSRT